MYGWRGTIGLFKTTFRAGPLEAFIRFMPDGVCVVPRYVGIRAGTEKEFEDTLAIADQRVGELAELKVDLALLRGLRPTCSMVSNLTGNTPENCRRNTASWS
jgi:hypothetical protein